MKASLICTPCSFSVIILDNGFRSSIHIFGHADSTVGLKITAVKVVMVVTREISFYTIPPPPFPSAIQNTELVFGGGEGGGH